MEVWKAIDGYEGVYEVSNHGRVRSLDRYDSMGRFRPGKILKQCYDGQGNYVHVNLCGKSTNVHRLVAKAFIPNPNGYSEVNHIDEDKTNNHVMNLEWCTHQYNNTYGSKLDSTKGVKNPQAKLTESDILLIKEIYKPHSKDNGAKALAKRFGVSHHYIYHLVRNDRWGWVR